MEWKDTELKVGGCWLVSGFFIRLVQTTEDAAHLQVAGPDGREAWIEPPPPGLKLLTSRGG